MTLHLAANCMTNSNDAHKSSSKQESTEMSSSPAKQEKEKLTLAPLPANKTQESKNNESIDTGTSAKLNSIPQSQPVPRQQLSGKNASPIASKEQGVEGAPAKPLSNAQKKALQKAEKAARRAQAKAVEPAPQNGPTNGEEHEREHKAQQQHPTKQSQQLQPLHQHKRAQSSSSYQPPSPTFMPKKLKDKGPDLPELFAHLPVARRIPLTQAHKSVHPAVLAIGQQMGAFVLTDSMERLEAMLLALIKVIDVYETPKDSSFSRHFVSHVLNHQIDYLSNCRPMCFCMGSAVRWLKLKITSIDPDISEQEAKTLIQDQIRDFIMSRIALADTSVVDNAVELVRDGDVILTFGRHRLVERTLKRAKCGQGKTFEVVVVDDPVEQAGEILSTSLSDVGIKVLYLPAFGGLDLAMRSRATKVMLGAEAMFVNGTMYGQAGCADITICAKAHSVPVVALCHSFNFNERSATDSLTYNEVDPDRCTEDDFRLLFDTSTYITTVVTDVGAVSPTSAMTVMKRWEEVF